LVSISFGTVLLKIHGVAAKKHIVKAIFSIAALIPNQLSSVLVSMVFNVAGMGIGKEMQENDHLRKICPCYSGLTGTNKQHSNSISW
jgi:hypothetical protein